MLMKFVHLAKYFNPRDNMDPKSPYSIRTVNAEKIFAKTIGEFNPYSIHQDCHEFLVQLLDKLHDEMALLKSEELEDSQDKPGESQTTGASDWNEIGTGSL